MEYVTSVFVLCLINHGNSVMIKQECPYNEVYRSCAFTEEYTCWESRDMSKRVLSLPERLTHCKSGCYCKKGYVRAFPHSSCVPARSCRDRALQEVISKLPDMVIDF